MGGGRPRDVGGGETDRWRGGVRFKSAEVLKSSNFMLRWQFLHHSDEWKIKTVYMYVCVCVCVYMYACVCVCVCVCVCFI